MNKPQFFACFCLCLFLVTTAIGQDLASADTIKYAPSIYIIGKNYGDSVVLRWAPTDPMLWRDYNETGYIIEKYELSEETMQRPVRKRLTDAPIKPWTLEEWKAKALPEDSMAAVAAQLLYGKRNIPVVNAVGKSKSPSSDVNIAEAMNQKYDMENRYGLALFMADNSTFIATGLGFRFVDRDIQEGKVYIYSIHAQVDPKKQPADTSAVLIKTNKVEPLSEMPEIFYYELDREVIFYWNRTLADYFFTSYYYERSDDGGKIFTRRNRLPYLQPKSSEVDDEDDQIVLKDSLPENYKKYHYRIIGVTPFGDLGKPSPAMAVMGRDKTPPEPPRQISANHITKNHVEIKWEKPAKEKDFAGFMVGRGESFSGPFTPLNLTLLGANTTSFLDTTAVSWGTNYYVVSAVDTASNAGISIPAYVVMIDTVAPSQPKGLYGKIDTTGIVRIHWEWNEEPDLLGYLVYVANAKDHTFSPVTRDFIVDSTFTDSISLYNLTKSIYYRIVAFDKNRNPSPFSDILELKKPDRIPPVAPVFTDFYVSDTAVSLHWAASSSSDAIIQKLFRREKEGQWVEIATFDNAKEAYNDTAIMRLGLYEYSLMAVDDDGNISERSFPLSVRIYDSGIRKEIEKLSGKLEEDGVSITLSWHYPVKEDYYFIVYRSVNEEGLQMYETIPSGQVFFKDANLRQGQYEYALKAIYKDGAQSPITTPVKVEVKSR